jgi:N-methylhydantoinase A
MAFFVGTDVGGTFTDLWVADASGEARVFKSPTTVDVMGGVINVVTIAAQAYGLTFPQFCAQIARFGHGTTVSLNALLTGRAAKAGIVTTQGFGDTLEIGRMRRQTSGLSETEVTDYFLHNRHLPIVPRDLVVEVIERIDANGRVIAPLDEPQAREQLRALKARQVEAIAICTLWSTANPAHELRLKELAAEELPDVFITLSHEISAVVGEYGRMSTAAANAALGPIAGRYLARLEQALRDAGMRVPILMMTNAGGVLPTAVLNDRPAFALFSGPAAGVIGSLAIGEKLGVRNLLTTDIGGTSFDVGVVVDSKPLMRREIAVAGADIRVPSIDVASIGAGGGSIAAVQFGNLTVGPQSAGANPGPACYGRGGVEPTATDADLVLGVLDPDNFLGGRMRLDVEAARRAITDKIAKPLGMDLIEAAWGIREVLDSKMADLLRRSTIERGHDPREFTLFANGGAGPSHAWALVRELGLDGFIVPAAATAQSAFGCANSSLGLTKERPVYLRMTSEGRPQPADLAAIDGALTALDTEARRGLTEAGARGEIAVERVLAIRYRGQTNALDITITAGTFDAAAFQAAVKHFERDYESRFGTGATYTRAGFEIISARIVAQGSLPPPASTAKGEKLRQFAARRVVFDHVGGPVETAIYRTTFPPPGSEVNGPAIIEFPGQSVVVPPRGVATADRFGNLHVSTAR